MKNIWIIKAGGTFPGLATEYGDFEHWICREMGLALSDVRIYDVRGSEPLPETIRAHVVHSQTVTRLPSDAIRLASNDHEPVHAYRVGAVTWGVQFHPEFDERIMRKYVEEYCDRPRRARRDNEASRVPVQATPEANQILARFAKVVDHHGR